MLDVINMNQQVKVSMLSVKNKQRLYTIWFLNFKVEYLLQFNLKNTVVLLIYKMNN